MTLEGGFTLQRSLPRRVAGGNTLVRGDLGWQVDEMEQSTVDCNGLTVKALKPAQPPIPILVVFAPPALRRAPLERCGGRPLVQVTHDAGTLRP
jgi:hypothetical protein